MNGFLDYQELLSFYVTQNNELQVRDPNVLTQGSSISGITRTVVTQDYI